MPCNKPNAVLADDHPGILDKVSEILGQEVTIVAKAHDGRESIQAAMEFEPDLMILDVAMPNLTGIDAAREMRRRGLPVRIIFLTIQEDPEFIHAARELNASYVLKKKMRTDLLLALKEELAGRRFFSSTNGTPTRA